jgi:hypothetical protein
MGEEDQNLPQFNIPTIEAYSKPFMKFMNNGMFKSPTSAFQTGMEATPSIFGMSAVGAGPQQDGVGSVTNTTQDASKTSGNIIEALDAVNKFYKEGMKGAYEGLPVIGDRDVKRKIGAGGQIYYTAGGVTGGTNITGEQYMTGEKQKDIFGKEFEYSSQGTHMYDGTEESRLDAFGRRQAESAQKTEAANTTPAALVSDAYKKQFQEANLQKGRNVISETKGRLSGMGYDPETGVYDPRNDDRENISTDSTGLLKQGASNKASEAGGRRMEAGQKYSDEMIKGISKGMSPIGALKAYRQYKSAEGAEKMYDKAGAALSPTGKIAYGKGGYAYTSDRKQSPESKAFVDSEVKKRLKQKSEQSA